MEQELAEAVKQREEERQQWVEQASRADAELAALRTSLEEALEGKSMEVARQESELASLRESERLSQEALEKEKLEVARLEREVALMKEAELAAVQASHDASERDRAERVQLESELASMREAVEHASRDASEREKSEVDKLERELASLKEEHEDAQKKGEILGEMWRHLRPLALEDVTAAEELPVPADLSLFLDTVESIETRLTRLKESEEHCAELTHTMETLQGKQISLFMKIQRVNLKSLVFGTKMNLSDFSEQLDRKNTEHEESAAKIQELEQQIVTVSAKNPFKAGYNT